MTVPRRATASSPAVQRGERNRLIGASDRAFMQRGRTHQPGTRPGQFVQLAANDRELWGWVDLAAESEDALRTALISLHGVTADGANAGAR
jgi:hypothetical protein